VVETSPGGEGRGAGEQGGRGGKKGEGRREGERGFVGPSGGTGRLIERGFLWARVDTSVNEAFPRKPGGGYSCGEGLRHQWGCEGKAPALSIAILSSVAIKGFLTCHGGSAARISGTAE